MKIRFLVFPILLLVFVCAARSASAQPAASRFEVGVQAAVLRLSDFGGANTGIGGRFSASLSRWITADVEVNFFPNDDIVLPVSSFAPDLRVAYARRRADAFAGVKVGWRGERLGIFAKARPGLTRLTHQGLSCAGEVCALMLFVLPEYRTEFALDLGGVVEVYPSGRTVARVELGDTMIRHRSAAPPCPSGACTSHNIATRFGMGLRF
jgi:hypothetical protein